MKKVLVLVADYPNNDGCVALMYVHTRNIYYLQHGIDVTVLNFRAEIGYEKDGIKVISLEEYKTTTFEFDTLILHAPNIRNHYLFLKKYENKFNHLIFFFHGHEVLKLNETYPKPYSFMPTSSLPRTVIQEIYDIFKLKIWENYLPRKAHKSDFIFVSETFYNEFKKYTKLNNVLLKDKVHIINNSVGEIFEKNSYDQNSEKFYDYITIRNMIDESVYCIDLLCKIAVSNPDKRFLLIGRGKYFDYNIKPNNIEWVDRYLSHEEMLKFVDSSKCAIMLSRRDTQGVMACELMTYGIPLIVSDIPIAREIFKGTKTAYLNNKELNLSSITISAKTDLTLVSKTKYSRDNTILKEVKIIQ